jgi:hypothetical protein
MISWYGAHVFSEWFWNGSSCSNYYYYYLYYYVVSCHRTFLPGTAIEPAMIPSLRLKVSDCNVFRIMCNVTSVAILCSEYIGCFLDVAYKFYFYYYYYYYHHHYRPGNPGVTEENYFVSYQEPSDSEPKLFRILNFCRFIYYSEQFVLANISTNVTIIIHL